MKGFKTPPHRLHRFGNGHGEFIEVRVTSLPLLFLERLNATWPPPVVVADEDQQLSPAEVSEMNRYYHARGLIFAAEGLRYFDEDVPPAPGPGEAAAAWSAYADRLREEFQRAGFTDRQIAVMGESAMKLGADAFLEALESEGNG